MDVLYKLIRGVLFPFRFLYLLAYSGRMQRRRDRYLRDHALPVE